MSLRNLLRCIRIKHFTKRHTTIIKKRHTTIIKKRHTTIIKKRHTTIIKSKSNETKV